MVFFDVGSNVGYYTLLAAPLVGQSGQIHAFEPVAEQHADLRANLERNQLLNVVPERLILTDRADFDAKAAADRIVDRLLFTNRDRSLTRKAPIASTSSCRSLSAARRAIWERASLARWRAVGG